MKREDEDPIRGTRRAQWHHLADLLRHPEILQEDVPSSPDGSSRRDFLRLMGASMGLAGLAACTRAPDKQILPYSVQPPEVTPGVPRFYATTMTLDGYGTGLLVESHEGHPTKIEGNPDHPASLGAAGVFEQALVLSLYDPSRPREGMRRGLPAGWPTFANACARAVGTTSGRGLHFLLEPTGSPLREDLIERLRAKLPEARFHYHAPLARDRAWNGSRLALGRVVEPRFALGRAKAILSIGSDFVAAGPGHLRHARDLASGRRQSRASDGMNRLYVLEGALSVTGSAGDHRLALRESEIVALTLSLAAELLRGQAPADLVAALARGGQDAHDAHGNWVSAVARDLLANRGASAVIVGDAQPPALHALGHAMNAALGNVGTVIDYAESPILDAGEPTHGDLTALTRELLAGNVERLVILGGNPVYDACVDLDFAHALRRAGETAYVGQYANETASAVDWFFPEAHVLEAWGDARAFDGTVSIVQPLIAPLFGGHTIDEALALFLGVGAAGPDAHALIREYWLRRHGAGFEASWAQTVRSGVMAGTRSSSVDTTVRWDGLLAAVGALGPKARDLELRFAPDSRVHDGRFTNNAWLLELPDPVTQLTWGNAALMSPATMRKLEVEDEDVVELRLGGRSLRVPALAAHGHADDAVTLALGYGRQGDEQLASNLGVNANLLRTARAPYVEQGVQVVKTGERQSLARAQLEFDLHGRGEEVLLHRSLDEYRRDPAFTMSKNTAPTTLYELAPAAARQWGMSIDLSACTGCSACVIACQAENNVPVVGKGGVEKGRRMHWLRIDRYVDGDDQLLAEPMLCQHCEKAPCEYVCPVNATTHSADGLNQMVYNRCVGTRFCSNNCPYKVRRFNYFNYTADLTPVERLVHNPDVTVRDRGVMEKCSYCVQRIREVEIRARVAGRSVRDGEVRTACQQTCPSQAIVFGDIADRTSQVAGAFANERGFAVLHDLGTVPRTRYLAKIRNVNPDIG